MKYYILSHRSVHKGQSGEGMGSTYDLSNACKSCGTGAVLIGKLYTKGLKNATNDCLYTLDGDNIISKKLYETIIKNGAIVNDVSLVSDGKGQELPLFCVNPKLSFPRMQPFSQGLTIEGQCPVCKQNDFFNDVIIGNLEKGIQTYIVPLKFHYNGVDSNFLNQSDIFHTWECMGLSNIKAEGNRVIRYARPLLIVSERIKEVFENFKIKKVLFDEITICNGPVELQ
ncbi:MAG TPA: hypothetical protein VIN08_16905 [Ohtaekwangia sp.]|uniref:hypothetical protein n=1 Tax=Ohtaekwangia sp. TaxID=2066019 RepID=UPI002F9449D8